MRKRQLIWLTLLLTVGMLLTASPALAEGELPDDGITVWNEDYTLAEGDRLDGDLVVFNGSAFLEVDSRVEGSVIVWKGDAEVDGTIESDLVVSNGEITLGEDARIERNVICSWSCDVEQAEGAHVEGIIIEGTRLPLPDLPFTPEFQFEQDRGFRMPFPVTGWAAAPGAALGFALRFIRGVASILVIAVVAGLVALIWPRQTARPREGWPTPGSSSDRLLRKPLLGPSPRSRRDRGGFPRPRPRTRQVARSGRIPQPAARESYPHVPG